MSHDSTQIDGPESEEIFRLYSVFIKLIQHEEICVVYKEKNPSTFHPF